MIGWMQLYHMSLGSAGYVAGSAAQRLGLLPRQPQYSNKHPQPSMWPCTPSAFCHMTKQLCLTTWHPRPWGPEPYLPHILKLQLLDCCCLQLQQAALCWVAVDAHNMASTVQQQVEAVAASRGKGQHSVVAIDVHHLCRQQQHKLLLGLSPSSKQYLWFLQF